jgi:hypothetical protein
MLPLIITAGLATLVVAYLRISRAAFDEFADRVDALTPGELPPLVAECIAEFSVRLNLHLDMADLERSARTLDEAFRRRRTVLELASPRRRLRAAELAGAFAGELVRRHARGVWMIGGGRSPGVRVRSSEGDREILPFVDVVNHFRAGRTGDLSSLILFVSGRSDVPLRAGHWAEKRMPIE